MEVAAFTILVSAGLLYGGYHMDIAPISTEHNVRVLEALGNNEWRMQSDEEGDFVYRGCPDFPNSDVIWAGYIADRAKWKEYGRCKSIRDTGLGFYWREGHSDWRKVN